VRPLNFRRRRPDEFVRREQCEGLFAIRSRSKDKVGSLRSTEHWFALRSLTHYALNNDERATHSRFPFTNVMGRVRECLTLMRGQSANADCRRAPGRHLWFTDVIPGGPFATRAHASNVAGNRMVFVHSNRSGCRMMTRGSGMNGTRKLAPAAAGRWFASLNKSNGEPPLPSGSPFWISAFSPWLHRADTCAWSGTGASAEPAPDAPSCRHGSAHARRLTRQLCTRSTPLRFISQAASHFASFRRPQTVETVKSIVCARRRKQPDGRKASPVAEDKAIAPRGFARCKTPSLTVSTAIFRPLHFAGATFRRSENARPHCKI
jgi:hypothetical protein